MKKKTIFQCVILFFSILNIHVGMAGPEQVSMHIYGNVVDQGCDVATKSALQNIHIGDFNISDFQAANTVSTAADLNIDITSIVPLVLLARTSFLAARLTPLRRHCSN